jgi:hypothetical protein
LKIQLKKHFMKYFLTFALASTVLLFSCKKEADIKNTSTSPTNVVPFTEVGNQMKLQQQTTSTDPKVTETTSTGVGLNPAHGQPGHRCEIPVGAPLNSAPVPSKTAAPTATTTVTTTAPTVTNPAVANPTTPTPEGMNPPHGQTNHRCDVAVGAPLPKE